MNLDTLYDTILQEQLTARLNRAPLSHELLNADKDSDLVNETLWQIICKLNEAINTLSNGKTPSSLYN